MKDLFEQIKEKLKSSKNTFLEDEIAALDSGDSDSDRPSHLVLVNSGETTKGPGEAMDPNFFDQEHDRSKHGLYIIRNIGLYF